MSADRMTDLDALPVVAYRFRWKAGTGEPVDINPWSLCTEHPFLKSARDIDPLVLASALSQAIAQRDEKDRHVAQLQAENERLRFELRRIHLFARNVGSARMFAREALAAGGAQETKHV